jgi:apolipoprotein N-acyltransferase
VQGNVARPGLDFNAERRQVLDNHVAATLKAQEDVDAGRAPAPDLVVWPENASDIDPLRNADAKSLILETVHALKRPLIVGGLLEEPVGFVSNVALLFEPGKGNTDRYVKRHPVPFAEYIPNRAFWRMFSTEVDLVTRDFVQGPAPGVFRVTTASGQQIRAGLAICFEVAYDDIMRDAVQGGANVLVVQTNNATFGYTAESPQQLAISRLRAMEFGRSVVHVSTVGQSALVTPDGTAHQVTSLFTQAVVRGALPLRDATTLATRLGEAPEWVAAAALLTMLALGVRGGRPAVPETTKEEDDDDAA